ncbi:ZIP family metal transporter [Haloferacaceae archaeon DSL9]
MVSLYDVIAIAFLAGAATGLGALPTFVTTRISHRVYDGALGLAAGIMVGASVFALLIPGLELGTLPEVVVGLVCGGAFLLVANDYLPHAHFLFEPRDRRRFPESRQANDDVRRAALIGGSITIHNVPEGFAIGIAFASGLESVGTALAVAIAVQNVPDGFAMAVPASQAGVGKWKTVALTTLSGAIPEPLAAAAGFALVAVITGLFPVAAGFAAGAMLAVVFREMIPASHSHGYADTATLLFIIGLGVMVVVDVGLAV